MKSICLPVLCYNSCVYDDPDEGEQYSMAEESQLSEREREILKLVATGATNQQIAPCSASKPGSGRASARVSARPRLLRCGAGAARPLRCC